MTGSEAHAIATAVAEAARDGVRRVAGVHQAIARRSWRPVGPWGAPSKAIHDLAAGVAYASVGAGIVAGGVAVAQALDALARSRRWRELSASPSGAAALGVLDAFAGDHLARHGSPLALPMRIRHEGWALPLDNEAGVAGIVGQAGGEVAVFVHGLAGWEGAWWWGASGEDRAPAASYGDRLRDERGLTPLYVRYNSGLAVADNGRHLADMLGRLASLWPVPLERVHLVGHSMGGLVVRSACHVGAERGDAWVDTLEHCVYLGTPHLGAPLARAAVALGSLLVRVPELRPFAALLERPSAGIRDLRFGLPLTLDVDEADPADWFGRDLSDVALLPSARHHAVSAAVTGRPGSPVDRVLGDLLVLTASANGDDGARRRVGLVRAEGATVAPANHLSLLNHPTVLARLSAWLDQPAPTPATST